MSVSVMFILLASVAPFLFIYLRRKMLAALQFVLLAGMWVHFIMVAFQTPPGIFSATWTMFYLSLLLAEVAWVMFFIYEIKLLIGQSNSSGRA
ncbi:MAG TPA: hypothetical protein VK111_04725 [Virgibacillus sp.]|nr:hypothetical protein [Virgibacillus sp.]